MDALHFFDGIHPMTLTGLWMMLIGIVAGISLAVICWTTRKPAPCFPVEVHESAAPPAQPRSAGTW